MRVCIIFTDYKLNYIYKLYKLIIFGYIFLNFLNKINKKEEYIF